MLWVAAVAEGEESLLQKDYVQTLSLSSFIISKVKGKKGKAEAQTLMKKRIVVRRIAPSISEDGFFAVFDECIGTKDPEERAKWMTGRYFASGEGKRASRAYIDFVDSEHVIAFEKAFRGHKFTDAHGVTTEVSVEYAPIQQCMVVGVAGSAWKRDSTIAEDDDYIRFVKDFTADPSERQQEEREGDGEEGDGEVRHVALLAEAYKDMEMRAKKKVSIIRPKDVGAAEGASEMKKKEKKMTRAEKKAERKKRRLEKAAKKKEKKEEKKKRKLERRKKRERERLQQLQQLQQNSDGERGNGKAEVKILIIKKSQQQQATSVTTTNPVTPSAATPVTAPSSSSSSSSSSVGANSSGGGEEQTKVVKLVVVRKAQATTPATVAQPPATKASSSPPLSPSSQQRQQSENGSKEPQQGVPKKLKITRKK